MDAKVTAWMWAIGLALIAGFGDVLGGYFTVWRKQSLSRKGLVYSTAGAAGFMIGVALLDRIPDVYSGEGHPSTAIWVLGGFLFIYVLENFFATHAHHGERAPNPLPVPARTQSHSHDHSHDHHTQDSLHGHGYLEEAMHTEHGHQLVSQFQADDCIITPTAGIAAQWGLLLHTAFDGIAIGAGFASSPHTGFMMFLAVICHKIPEGFSLAALLLASGRSQASAFRSSIGLGISTVLGSVAAMLFSNLEQNLPHVLLALATGSFLYVATCDLLPATNRDRDRVTVLIVLLGVALFWLSSEALKTFGLH